jgi:hypothetical protein
VLVFHLFSLILRDRIAGAAGSSLFAVASIHTGAVFWISARTTLLSTALLLGAVLLLLGGAVRRRTRVISAAVLFALSLLAKETAIAGLALIPALYYLYRDDEERRSALRGSLASWTAVSVAYLTARYLVVGGFTQHNWGPGFHMLRNTAGGLLYQLRPWPLFSLFYHEGTLLKEPTHPFLPELLAVGAIALFWYLGEIAGRRREYLLGTFWAIAAIVPASAFRHRFYSTVSITQNRYYYLSSVGVILIFALVLSLLWGTRRRSVRALCAAAVLIFIAGSYVRIDRLEKIWSDFTRMYEESTTFIISTVEERTGFTAAALEDPPLAFPYAGDAISLYKPEWMVSEVEGGPDNAMRFAPCIYMKFEYEGDRVKSVDVRELERE